MIEVAQSAKIPRPIHSKSDLFEVAYVKFMAEVFEQNVQSLEAIETSDSRLLLIAGAYRLRLDKKTGLLHSEFLTHRSDGSQTKWVAGRFLIPSVWASNAELDIAIVSGWSHRLTWYVPPAKICFPGVSQQVSEFQWQYALEQAGSRRLGKKAGRLYAIKQLTSLLWNFLLDREVLRLSHAFFGRRASLNDYNFAVSRKIELTTRLHETPNLAPLIGTFLKNDPKLKTGRCCIPLDILSQARTQLLSRLPNDQVLAPAGWRYLTSLSPTALSAVWQIAGTDAHKRASNLVPTLNLVSRTGEHPPLAFLKRLLHDIDDFRCGIAGTTDKASHENLVRFFRLAAQQAIQAKKKRRLKRFLAGDYLLAMDWLKQRGTDDYYEITRVVANVPKNATWASIMRTQITWHAHQEEQERARREADERAQLEYLEKRDAIAWDSALTACEVMGALITPLVNGKALREEGERMRHCVGNYVRKCFRGGSRIFAIQHLDQEATLEIVETDTNQWRVRQVFGPSNCEVSPAINALARIVAKMYQDAARKTRALRGESVC